MKVLLILVAWSILLTVSWPLALLALVLWPLVWLISLPLILVGLAMGAALHSSKQFSSCRPEFSDTGSDAF